MKSVVVFAIIVSFALFPSTCFSQNNEELPPSCSDLEAQAYSLHKECIGHFWSCYELQVSYNLLCTNESPDELSGQALICSITEQAIDTSCDAFGLTTFAMKPIWDQYVQQGCAGDYMDINGINLYDPCVFNMPRIRSIDAPPIAAPTDEEPFDLPTPLGLQDDSGDGGDSAE